MKNKQEKSLVYECEHSTEIQSNQYERYFVLLEGSRLEQLLKDPVLLSLFKMRPGSFHHIFPAPCCTKNIMERILAEHLSPDRYSDELIASQIKDLLVNLYRKDASRFPITKRNFKKEIYLVQREIDMKFKEGLKIADLADNFFINPYYLTHQFKELTGHSPKHYLTIMRLSYAKTKLLDTRDSIDSIAVQSGFLDANSFIRSFKNEFGTTPSRYRKQGASAG